MQRVQHYVYQFHQPYKGQKEVFSISIHICIQSQHIGGTKLQSGKQESIKDRWKQTNIGVETKYTEGNEIEIGRTIT